MKDKRQASFDFENGWQSIGQLPTGHYAIGRTAWGAQVDIHCIAPGKAIDCRTGEPVSVTVWKPR